MKLGVMIESQEGVGWPEWKNIVQWTEELGFESLWCSDHFFSINGDRMGDALETLSALLYAANNSRRIRFGSLVLSMTSRHPAIIARMAAAIDQLSDGRFILGVGAGWNIPEHDAFGITLPPPGPRIEALDEGIKVIRALFGSNPASYDGKHFKIKDAYLNPKPKQSPLPILIGGGGEKRTLRVVARHANEWNIAPVPLDLYRQKLGVLEMHCEKEGRDPTTIARSLMCGLITGETALEVERQVQADLERRSSQLRVGLDRPSDLGALQPSSGAPRLPSNVLAGTPSQIVEQMKMWEGEGVGRIMLQHRGPPEREALQLISKEILPKV